MTLICPATSTRQDDMGWQQQTFIGSLVLVFGTGNNTGLFVYNGTPKLGNPPVFWVTTATKDPYNNTIPSLSGLSDAFLVYSGTPALGNLIGSITGVPGTDRLGNVYKIGINAYVVSTPGTTTYQVRLGGTAPAFGVSDVANPSSDAPGVHAKGSSGVTPQSFAQLYSGLVAGGDVASAVECDSATHSGITSGLVKVTGGITQFASGAVEIDRAASLPLPATTPSTMLNTSAVGFPNVVPSGDQNVYNAGHLETSAAGGQIINSTTLTTVNGTTFTVGAFAYHLQYTIFYKGGQAAGTSLWNMGNGSAVFSFYRGRFRFLNAGGNPSTYVENVVAAANSTVNGPVLLNNVDQMLEVDLFVTFSSSGTVFMQAAEGTAGDTFTMDGAFSRLEKRQST